jgi:hypothetical protein
MKYVHPARMQDTNDDDDDEQDEFTDRDDPSRAYSIAGMTDDEIDVVALEYARANRARKLLEIADHDSIGIRLIATGYAFGARGMRDSLRLDVVSLIHDLLDEIAKLDDPDCYARDPFTLGFLANEVRFALETVSNAKPGNAQSMPRRMHKCSRRAKCTSKTKPNVKK